MTNETIDTDAVVEPERQVYPDTNLIDWPSFVIEAMKRRRDYMAIAGGLPLLVVGIAALYLPVMFLPLAVIGAVVAGIAAAVYLAESSTRPVVVERYDESGDACQDHQSWWATDAATWPDKHKRTFNGKRVLWIDRLDDEAPPIPFNPWINPIPVPDEKTLPVTGSRVAAVRAKSGGASRILKYRTPTPGENFQQGLMVAVILGSFVAILMAANRIAEMMGFAV